MSEEYELVKRINHAMPSDAIRTEVLAVLVSFAACLAIYAGESMEGEDLEPELWLSITVVFSCIMPLFMPYAKVDIDIEHFLTKEWEEHAEEDVYRKIKEILVKLNDMIKKHEEV